jgi:pyruvate dehydrogenase E2 component (dihydrolipoamide acetyltransferase)
VEVAELSRVQEAEARAAAESKATIPHVHLEVLVRPAGQPEAAEVLRAAALALRRVPRANGAYRDGKLSTYGNVNVAFAVEAGGTLAHPVIRDADSRGLKEIAAEMEGRATRAREGQLTQRELAGATFSMADLRGHGIARAEGVVRRGQAAYLLVGSPDPETLSLSLACDARALQGSEGPDFLGAMRAELEGRG